MSLADFLLYDGLGSLLWVGGLLTIEKVYSYNPVPGALSNEESKHILGVQAQLWSEYFKDFKKVEYFAFPRIAALAEIAWSPLAAKDFTGFRKRLDGVCNHYETAGFPGKRSLARP